MPRHRLPKRRVKVEVTMPFMKSNHRISVLGLGALALVGCEFGNKNATQLSGYDVISGYYSTLPQSISFHAQIGTGAARNASGTVTQMPAFMKALMGNPVMLFFDNPISGDGSLRAHIDTTIGIATKIQDRVGTFGYSDSASGISSGCKLQQDTVNSGSFSQAAATSVIAGLTVRGKLTLDYTISTTLIGDDVDCDAMRAVFKSCYIDNVGCSTDNRSIFYRAFITGVFGPLINAGVMTDAEIGSARMVSYHAIYQ